MQEETVLILETQGSDDEIAAASVNDVPYLEKILGRLFGYKFKLSNNSSNDIKQDIWKLFLVRFTKMILIISLSIGIVISSVNEMRILF